MGNQHSNSSIGVETRHHHHHHHHTHHSNKYNISSNSSSNNKVCGRHQEKLTHAPNNNTKSPINNTTTTTSTTAQDISRANAATSSCICASLNYNLNTISSRNYDSDKQGKPLEFNHQQNILSTSPSYELVKIETCVRRKLSQSEKRTSYSWRKITHETQINIPNSTQEQGQSHHPDCPHFVVISANTTIHTKSTSGIGEQVISMNSLEKFCKYLVTVSNSNGQISKVAFEKFVLPHCNILSEYVWSYIIGYSATSSSTKGSTISEQQFFRATDKIYSYITDKDQIQFWFKVFGKGNNAVYKDDFKMFLLCAYQLSTTKTNEITRDIESIDDLVGNEWIEAVTKSCFHIKEEMTIIFLSNWIVNNLPRILIPLHKYVIHQLTTGCSQQNAKNGSNVTPNASKSPESNGTDLEKVEESIDKSRSPSKLYNLFNEEKLGNVSTMNPVLLWLLTCALPTKYISSLIKKPEVKQSKPTTLTPQQFILQLKNNASEPDSWTLLYNSEEHGSSVNRFQFHVFHYRGPTLMVINADNGYKICLACDIEWKESCHFWGGDDASIFQLEPEFRLVEKGKGILYANFSIRGYPFGIQAGKDPKNVSVEINPDFQYISFKKIPCKIESILVYGCAVSQATVTQNEYKKWEAKECEKQKKVNLHQGTWNDNPDKYLLELGGSYVDYGYCK